MYSVTSRIKTIIQPRGGYLKVRDLTVTEYVDKKTTYDVTSKYKSIQGMAVDYLTRLQCGASREEAFQIPLLGAKKLNQTEQAYKLLRAVKGLDKRSIINACKLTSYDVAFRASAVKFVPVSSVMPDEYVIHNIKVYVQRCSRFFQQNRTVTDFGLTFTGGYNDVVSSGDCDFLTGDTLWDLKVSRQKPTCEHTLQLLMYYILGIHSVHSQFQKLHTLGIFNPELNCAYTIDVENIQDLIFQTVSHRVLGYHTPDDPSKWRMAFGTDPDILREAMRFLPFGTLGDTGFRPERYPDGVHDISIDDYWSYWSAVCNEEKLRPKFPYTKYVKLLKRDGFMMFLSISKHEEATLLYGASRRKLNYPISYYFDRMSSYGNLVLERFSKYWFTLYGIAETVRRLRPDLNVLKENQYDQYVQKHQLYGLKPLEFEDWYRYHEDTFNLTGRVHGCIVSLDFTNHIYLNPYDGSIAPYHAMSMDEKFVFRNVESLLSAHRPDMLPGYRAMLSDGSPGLIPVMQTPASYAITEDEIYSDSVLVTDTSMYYISNRLKVLQMIYDHRIICAWYDNFAPEPALPDSLQIQEITHPDSA